MIIRQLKYYVPVLIFLLVLTTGLSAQNRPAILIVFDASGSMAETVNGTQKIMLAKDAVEQILNSGISADFGLTVFGSEESSGIDAYYSPIPIGPDTHSGIHAEINTLSPAGKSPIASALIDGSMSFRTDNQNIIILITDGVENTGGGPIRVISTLRNRGILSNLFVVGFLDDPGQNPLITNLVQAGNGQYFPVRSIELLTGRILELISRRTEEQNSGLLGFRCFVLRENGFPAYGSTVEIFNETGEFISHCTFWRGIFENLAPQMYNLVATNGESIHRATAEISAGKMTEINFVFNIKTGDITFNHYILGTNAGKAYGTITKVYHKTGETVYTGTTWHGEVNNLPEGVYTIEGYIEGIAPQTQEINISESTHPVVDFYFPVGKGRIEYKCYLDSLENTVANGTVIKIFRLPYNELAESQARWRGTTSYLPIGQYVVEGNYKGIIRREQVEIKPDSTNALNFIFNIRQVRFSYRCFKDRSESPASGVIVQIINNEGKIVEESNTWRDSYILPEGIYTLQAQYQGKIVKRTINLYASNTIGNDEVIYFDERQ